MNIFTQEALILPSFQKKIGALRRIRFQKHPLFTTFSLFLKVNEVCKRFLYKTLYTLPFFKKSSPPQNLLETSTFYHIFNSFHSG